MAVRKAELPDEILIQMGDRSDWTDEFERRNALYNLVLASRHFSKVFTTILYQEFEHTEEDWLYERHLRSLINTIRRKPDLASSFQRLTILKWCPEVFFDTRFNPYPPNYTYDLVDQLLSLAWNVREVKIRLPNLPILNNKPFPELRKLHLFDFVPFVRGLTGRSSRRQTVYLPTINRDDTALNLRALSTVFEFPNLSQLNIEAEECTGIAFVRHDQRIISNIDTFQIHAGFLDTAIVSKALQSMRDLRTFRYSILKSKSSIEATSVHWFNPSITPSTQLMAEELKRHKETLTILEITKSGGLSNRGGEIIEPLTDFEQLGSLCIDAAMLLGRWHCNHPAGRIDDHPQTVLTWADIDKTSRRYPSELADCLPSGLEKLVLSINDDMSDKFLLDILSSLVRELPRLSALRQIAFFRHRISYCSECLTQHGKFPTLIGSAGDGLGLFHPTPIGDRDRTMLANMVKHLAGTGLKVFPAFEHVDWPSRRNLWEKAGPYLTGESDTTEIQFVQSHISYLGRLNMQFQPRQPG